MFYDKTATLFGTQLISDGMGGWIDSGEVELGKIRVASAPISIETVLKDYGVNKVGSLKLYTVDKLPTGNYTIKFGGNEYRVIQVNDYGTDKIILMELI